MAPAVSKVLVIGGGFSDMSAIELRKRGITVDLVEIDPRWQSYGAGISLGGATLRVLRTLGVLDAFLEAGYAADGAEVYRPDGTHITTLPTPRVAGDDVPGGGAVMRPVLAAILAKATRTADVKVMLGHTFTSIGQERTV
jgi:2-polyprenyl-6-methoxyphenol hydroxylase-like FAD-dependent oxidoreductase